MMVKQLTYRLRQVADYTIAVNTTAPQISADAGRLLSAPMLHQFRILPEADQLHLLRVFSMLVEMGADEDTTTAGLIHDVGKACAKCRITVLDRGLHVMFQRFAPGPYRKFAAIQAAPAIVRGLHRLANHAERGALAAAQAGYNERVVYLVRYHERGGDGSDGQLQMLRTADTAAGCR